MTSPPAGRLALEAPDLGAGAEGLTVVRWLVEEQAPVSIGERVVELLSHGVLCHVTSHATGRLARIEVSRGGHVQPGEVLAWIEATQQ